MKNQIIKLMLAITVAFTAFSCTSDDNNNEIAKLPTITETLNADAVNFSVLSAAIRITGITNFSSAGSYTVFAPNNAAFAAYTSVLFPTGINSATVVEPTTMSALQVAELKKLLQNHILGVGTKANDLLASGYVKTFAPGVGSTTLSMFVNKPAADVLVNGGATNGGATITTADIDASNGIIHKVDAVIKLPKLTNLIAANPDFSTLYSIVTSTATGTYGDQSANLAILNGAGPTTIFAPTNAAFTTATATGGFYNGVIVTTANTTKLVRYHIGASLVYTNTTTAIPPVTTTVTNTGNLVSNTATSFLPATATTDATVTTLAATTQKFLITKGTLKITELPAITVPASNIKIVNIQATNGNIHTIDRVLQPILP